MGEKKLKYLQFISAANLSLPLARNQQIQIMLIRIQLCPDWGIFLRRREFQ